MAEENNGLGLLIASAAGALINGAINAHQQNKQNAFNRELADLQYSREIEMINKQNDYNSAAAQMSRYAAAGLNPNLIYGSGSSTNQTSHASYNPPQISTYKWNLPNVLALLGMNQDISLKTSATKKNEEETRLKSIQSTSQALDNLYKTMTLTDRIKYQSWLNRLNERKYDLYGQQQLLNSDRHQLNQYEMGMFDYKQRYYNAQIGNLKARTAYQNLVNNNYNVLLELQKAQTAAANASAMNTNSMFQLNSDKLWWQHRGLDNAPWWMKSMQGNSRTYHDSFFPSERPSFNKWFRRNYR